MDISIVPAEPKKARKNPSEPKKWKKEIEKKARYSMLF